MPAGDSVINQIVPRLLKLSNKFSLSAVSYTHLTLPTTPYV